MVGEIFIALWHSETEIMPYFPRPKGLIRTSL